MEAFPSLTESGCRAKEFPFAVRQSAVRPSSKQRKMSVTSHATHSLPPSLSSSSQGQTSRASEGGREEILPSGPSSTKATATRSMSTPLWLSLKYRFSPSSDDQVRRTAGAAGCSLRNSEKGCVELTPSLPGQLLPSVRRIHDTKPILPGMPSSSGGESLSSPSTPSPSQAQ